MQKIFFIFFGLAFITVPVSLAAQSSATKVFRQEQAEFLRQMNAASMDSAIVYRISEYSKLKSDSIYSSIMTDAAVTAPEKEKAVLSLGYFMNELARNVAQQRSELYDIPGAFESYHKILKALLRHQQFTDVIITMPSRRAHVIAAAFIQYKEHALLDDIAVFKRMASTPEFILGFLETKPGFRFADSLLLVATAHDPKKIFLYLQNGKTEVKNKILQSKNIYLRQIVSLSVDKNATEFLPFVSQLAEEKLTHDSVLKTRTDVTRYYQTLINTLVESNIANDPAFVFNKILHKGVKEKSLYFYANQINELHNEKEATRFASVKGLRPEDIYYIITTCGEELYTSSYLGLYKRLMENFKPYSADSLFEIVNYDNFRIFMRLAANYNVMTDFLNSMAQENASALIRRFVSGIETDINSGLEKAMDIADSFTGLDSAIVIREMIHHELQSNLNRCQADKLFFGVRLYNILLQVFDLVKQKNSFNRLWSTLGNYEMLERKALQNKNGEIVQLVLFYGDEDGVASFNSFQKIFTDTSKWKQSKNRNWVEVRSVSDQPIIIYANMPLDEKEEMDIKAQDSLIDFLKQQSMEPVVLIHRGHSYHVNNTLKRFTPSVKLAILGSCGGSNHAISIANINPDAQIIVSKKTGTKSVNDPIIDEINKALLNEEDLLWSIIWEDLRNRFSKDEFTLNLFNEYIPPGKNVSLFVLKLFNFYNRPVRPA